MRDCYSLSFLLLFLDNSTTAILSFYYSTVFRFNIGEIRIYYDAVLYLKHSIVFCKAIVVIPVIIDNYWISAII